MPISTDSLRELARKAQEWDTKRKAQAFWPLLALAISLAERRELPGIRKGAARPVINKEV